MRNFPARGQPAPLGGHALDVTAQFDFFYK
jgi:hypothetical protein